MVAAPQPRTSGGFNQGLGQYNDNFSEHMDANAMQAAVQQKALAQQGTSSAQPATGGSALGTPTEPAAPVAPREVGTIQEELINRPVQDVVEGVKSIFNVYELLGINPATEDPETQAKKQQLHQRFERLTQEDQQVVQQKYEAEMKKKQHEEQEKAARDQQEKAAAAQTIVMPSSPQKGPIGPADAHKPKAVQRLEQDRKTLGGPQNVG